MRHQLTALLLAISCGALADAELLACGDKYIMPTRGTRFASPPPLRQGGAILIYANPSAELSRLVTRLSLAKALQDAGYQLQVAVDAAEFASALSTRRWDLVFVDIADARVADQGTTGRQAATVIPVSHTLKGDQWSNARRQYPAAIKAPSKARTFLDVIDAAIEKQRKTRTADSRP